MGYTHIYLPHVRGVLLITLLFLSHTIQVWAQNPAIVEHPEDDYVAKNEPATLNCKAEGSPKPKITWYRNGHPVVTSADNPSSHRMLLPSGQLFFLRIIHNKNAKPDVGVYYCNATNIHGSAISRNATLEIAVLREEFREEPNNVIVASGKIATFNCKPPKGEPEPSILWHKYTDPVQEDGRVTVTPSGSLVIQSVQLSDAGEYTCLAINKGGERESAPAKLTVLEKPKFSRMPSDEVANEQDIVELKCQATGDPKPTLEWRKENGRIPYGRARQLNDGTLRLEKVQASDDGTYVCVAQNEAGTVEAVGRITVNTHPSFQVRPKNQVVGRGRTVTLQCVVMGNPTPTVFWSKGTEQNLMFPNQENGRFSVAEDGTFRIERVQFDDAGEYVCQALNVIGSDKASAVIEVREQDSRPPPIIKIGPQNQTLPVKEVAWLPCQVIGDPQPTTRWYMSGRPIVTGSDHRITILDSGTLQISDVRVSDSATYTCKAVSETGETTWSASLVVTSQGPYHRAQKPSTFPGPPSKPVLSDITDTSVHITWHQNRNQGDSPVYGYVVEYFSHETPQGWTIAADNVIRESYTVRNLLSSTHYVFLVRAKNSQGIGLPSDVSDIIVTRERRKPHTRVKLPREEIKEKLDGMVIEVLKGESLNSTAIKVTWRPLKGFDAMDGYIIKYKQIKDLRNMRYGNTNSQRVYDPYITSYALTGLDSFAWYEICVQAFGGDVKSDCSDKIKVSTRESVPTAPPGDVELNFQRKKIYVTWSPPSKQHRNGNIVGYNIYCMDSEEKHNCSIKTNGTTNTVYISNIDSDRTFHIKLAARTNSGVGKWSRIYVIGPERTNIMKEPWFIGMLISAIGGMLWLALCVFSIWLCKKRKNRKKLAQNGMYSAVPVHKAEESSRAVADIVYAQKEGNVHSNISGYTGLQSDLASLLEASAKDVELKDQNIYNTASVVPRMKTFYQKPNTIPVSVAPYATTTLINTGGMPGHSHQGSNTCMEATFRPINHAYVHSSASGSGDSCQKPELRSSDSHSDNSRPNTSCPHEHVEMMSPGSDSGSLTTDEYGMPVKRTHKMPKHMYQGKQPMVNWSELLPPPPEHPPPSDVGSPEESPMNTLHRLERQAHRQANNRSPISPVSKISACSCPVPNDRMPMNIRNVPYSDNEFGMHSSRMHDCRPYSPKPVIIRRQHSPIRDGRMSPNKSYYHPCHHVTDQNDYNNIYPSRSYYSDMEMRNGVMGGSVYTPASLQGYHLEHKMDNKMCAQCSQDGVSVDRACQSSLPSLASECVNSHYQGRNADSPVSEEMPDYADDSDLEHGRMQCHTPESSGEEADFASAVAKAAEMSGLTVVGTTISDPKTGRKYRKHQRAAARPASPYSTDSNMSAVVRKPYPKSQRKKQMVDQNVNCSEKK